MQVILQSTLIESVMYDAESGLLRIYLRSGQMREFSNVPADVYKKFISTRSAGRFYMDNIRGKYPSVA
jgi:hypothetical protein